jgi:uncharacterized protein (DUF433 family)
MGKSATAGGGGQKCGVKKRRGSSMALVIETEPVPVAIDADGEARVGGTRVTLDTVVSTFEQGASAEEIVLRYPTLKLADVYAVITYYLRHRAEVAAYLRERHVLEEQVRQANEARFDLTGLRERLLARNGEQTGQ